MNKDYQTNHLDTNYGAMVGHVGDGGKVEINQFHTINKESELRKILNSLLNAPLEEPSELDKTSYKIEAKLEYNNITDDWYEIITDEFYLFESTINDTLKLSIDGIPQKVNFYFKCKDITEKQKEI